MFGRPLFSFQNEGYAEVALPLVGDAYGLLAGGAIGGDVQRVTLVLGLDRGVVGDFKVCPLGVIGRDAGRVGCGRLIGVDDLLRKEQ